MSEPLRIADERDLMQAALRRMRDAFVEMKHLYEEQTEFGSQPDLNGQFFDGYAEAKRVWGLALLKRDVLGKAQEPVELPGLFGQRRQLGGEHDSGLVPLPPVGDLPDHHIVAMGLVLHRLHPRAGVGMEPTARATGPWVDPVTGGAGGVRGRGGELRVQVANLCRGQRLLDGRRWPGGELGASSSEVTLAGAQALAQPGDLGILGIGDLRLQGRHPAPTARLPVFGAAWQFPAVPR